MTKQQALLPGVSLPQHNHEQDRMAPGDAESAPNEVAAAQDGEDWPALHDMMGSLFVFELAAPPLHPVTVLGLDSRPLSPAQQLLLDEAQVVAGGKAQLDRAIPHWEEVQDGREYHVLRAPLEPVLAVLEERRKAGRRVLVLADGDPLFFGIGATLTRQMAEAQLRCLPGVSALQEACARAALPWDAVRCVSLHGRNTPPVHSPSPAQAEDARWRPFNQAVFSGHAVCVLTDATSTPDVLARHLLDRGVEWLEVWICEQLHSPNERVRCLGLREAASLDTADCTHPCTVLLRPVAAPRRPQLGLPDSLLAVEKGLITKAPVRAAALSLLAVEPHHVVWDVGSGSGAVALEACALAHAGCVVAVEPSAGRALSIRENRRRFGAAILEVCQASAPHCLKYLPDPQRVFVGGGLSGDNGLDILEEICDRLPSGGRVVVSCVLLGTLHRALDFFQLQAWPTEVLHIQTAQAAPLADDLRLVPQNPVFLLSSCKP